MAQMQFCIRIENRRRDIKLFAGHYKRLLLFAIRRKAGFRESAGLFAVDVGDKLLYRRGNGDRKQYPQESGKLGTDDKSDDDEQRRYTDYFFDDHRIDKVRLKLLYHQVKACYQQERGNPAVGESYRQCGDSGEYLPEDRNKFEEAGNNRQQQCVWYAEYYQPQIQKYAHNNAEYQLPLHPLAYLFLGALPEIEHVCLFFNRRDYPQKVVNSGLLHGEIE